MIEVTAQLSLVVQIVTALIDAYGLTLTVNRAGQVFQELLAVELVVQMIELVFYVWLVSNIKTVQNITKFRYLDWMISTPVMLLTLIVYLDFDPKLDLTMLDYVKKNRQLILKVLKLNWLMLLAGYLVEINKIPAKTGVVLGWVPFLAYFHMIYREFIAKKERVGGIDKTKSTIFGYFFGVWSLYGVAALQSYDVKNSMYNILDLFAKNFFGVFLTYIVWQNRSMSPT